MVKSVQSYKFSSTISPSLPFFFFKEPIRDKLARFDKKTVFHGFSILSERESSIHIYRKSMSFFLLNQGLLLSVSNDRLCYLLTTEVLTLLRQASLGGFDRHS